ncbi:hypothetical protein SAMN05216196_11520 [Lutimaribacter pacificus]|uniref:Uncharacterized protein n=1 Tax=Lutimaribacter pacificus TaxID=391948 RepID=A0A1H0P114_9RHOB|nr:hypothetical protein SAMN05216196_11520 [Lutimaribacter pacificus]SHK97750.1 hypothetical protein SAMN05444142_11520 [Lutimaribacter pacificus]
MPQEKFLNYQASFDSLTETYVVCDQKVRTRHVNGANHRIELEVFDAHAASERSLKKTAISVGRGAPPNGIQEGLQLLSIIFTGNGW